MMAKAFAVLCVALLLHAAAVNAALESKETLLPGKGKLGLGLGLGLGTKGLGLGKLGKGKGDLSLVAVGALGKGQGNFPPAPADWAAGTCTGYPFCIPGYIPPTLATPSAVCPNGLTLDDSSAMCTQSQAVCLLGTQQVDDKCCIEKVSTSCFATMEAACPSDCATLGSICAPAKSYLDVLSVLKVESVANPSPKEAATGNAFVKLCLPKLDLGKGALVEGKGAFVENKVIPLAFGKSTYTKVEVAPKCFTKCCQQQKELLCQAPKIKQLVAPPTLTCPDGCQPAIGGQCVCDAGGPAPCPPGTKECSSIGGRICVSDQLCFGVDQCKVATILMPHLQAVGCPSAAAAPSGVATATAAAAAVADSDGSDDEQDGN